jgi:hypothetical protein
VTFRLPSPHFDNPVAARAAWLERISREPGYVPIEWTPETATA